MNEDRLSMPVEIGSPSPLIIVTKRLGLRRWKDSDRTPFSEMNQDAEVMRYFPSLLTPLESSRMVDRIEKHFDEHGFGLFAVEDLATQQFVGFTGFSIPGFESFFTPCVEIGWRYKKEAWGQGLATEAAQACLNYGFKTLQLDRIFSFTAVVNARSENVMKRIGMKQIGEFDHPNIEKGHWLSRHVLYEVLK